MRSVLAIGLIPCLVALGSCGAGDAAEETIEITVLVAFEAAAAAGVDDVRVSIGRAFDETNLVYANSAIDARLVPVHFVEVDYAVTDVLETLAHLLDPDDGVLDELHALRDEHEADIVILVSATPGATINASVMAVSENAFLILELAHMGPPHYGFAHEIGHLHGARHFSADEPLPEPFPYAHAFRNDTLRTVLSWGGQEKVPYFSGPGSVYRGVVLGDAHLHDNARAIRETAAYLSNFRGPRTPTDFVSPGTWPTLGE